VTRWPAALLLASLAVGGADAQMAAIGDISISDDAAHFDAARLRSGALIHYASPFGYAGVAAQTTFYSQSGWHRNAPAVLGLWRNQRRDTLAGTIAEAGLVRISGHTRVIGDGTWGLRPAAHTGIELLAASDVVETQRAIESATAYQFFGASIEQQLTGRFTAIGLAGYQHFTDHNERLHLRGRLIWLLVPSQGISAQVRWRQYNSRQADVGGAYFNPGRYRQWEAGLAIRKRHAGWIWWGNLSVGREEIGGTLSHATGLADFRAEGALGKNARLVIHASYNRSAGFTAADGYWYRTIGLMVVVPLQARD
jgi:hypothetical protein